MRNKLCTLYLPFTCYSKISPTNLKNQESWRFLNHPWGKNVGQFKKQSACLNADQPPDTFYSLHSTTSVIYKCSLNLKLSVWRFDALSKSFKPLRHRFLDFWCFLFDKMFLEHFDLNMLMLITDICLIEWTNPLYWLSTWLDKYRWLSS